MEINKAEILNRICYTELVYGRINKKLNSRFSKPEIEKMLFDIINETQEAFFQRTGKNIYVTNQERNIKITINSYNYRVITVDKLDKKTSKWERDLTDFQKEWQNDEEYIFTKTSGSTGVPKAVLLLKKAMIASALRTNQFFQLQKDDNVLLCLPVNYIAGKMMVVRAMVGGLNLITVPPVSLPDWEGRVAFAAMVPLQVQTLLGTEAGRERLRAVDKLLIGGSPVSAELEKELCELPVNAYVSYGMTETVSHVALCKIEKSAKEKIYHALPDVAFSTDDRNCLVIHAPYLQPEPFVTNDVVTLFSETSFSWLGRWDNVINSGGIKFFPEEIERKIAGLLSVRFYITSLPDPLLGQQIVLKIESQPWSEAEKKVLLRQIALCLSKYEVPKQLLFVDRFEETGTGKVKRESR